MARYKNPEERASETVTFRLTFEERRLLGYLADAEQLSLTDLIRFLLTEHAEKMGVVEVPASPAQTRPGKQRQKKRKQRMVPVPAADSNGRENNKTSMNASVGGASFFRDLVSLFREHFSGRAEGTKKELEETILFLCDDGEGDPMLSCGTPLGELTSTKLKDVRTAVMKSDIRLAKKNLHLTYLRMMLHFGVKQKVLGLDVNPTVCLSPLTMAEVPESWPIYIPPDTT
ncbi:MAG: hypothetical protein GY762_08490 [Proteobacteria bacterium]|nr:hypothetical protein [Pseudomonadota bacterium]